MSVCDLSRNFGEIAKNVLATAKKGYLFTPEIVPIPLSEITTDRLIIKSGYHDYEAYTVARVDSLYFSAQKETYRQLGICLLASLFHPEPKQIKINLTHPNSQIKALIFDHKTIYPHVSGFEYATKLKQYTYNIDVPQRHALPHTQNERHRLPGFRLVNQADLLVQKEDWLNRNVVWGCASAEGDMEFSSLLLNLSEENVTENEFVLESDLGFGGVCPGSPEVTLWLPGSIGWDGD